MNYCTAFNTKTDKEQAKILKVGAGYNLCDIMKYQHQKKFKKHANYKLKNRMNLRKFSNRTIYACLQNCDQKSIIYEKNDVDQQLVSLQHGLTQSQLEHCMMQIVQDLHNAPLIQAVSTSRFLLLRHLHVSERTISSPFVWFEIQSQLENFDPEMLILVNEIESPVAKCPYSSQFENSKFKMLPTCSLGIQKQQSSIFTSKWETETETDLVRGKFGDCCEEDENHSNASDFQGLGKGQHSWPQQKLGINYDSNSNKISTRSEIFNQMNLDLKENQECDQSSNLNFDRSFSDERMKNLRQKDVSPGQVVRYWGVVIQSKEMSLMDGCYLLTTTQNRGQHGCMCTHFHLTRVCQGVSLDNQLRNSWLGQQFLKQELQVL